MNTTSADARPVTRPDASGPDLAPSGPAPSEPTVSNPAPSNPADPDDGPAPASSGTRRRLSLPDLSGADDAVADWVAKAVAAYPRPSTPLTDWDASVAGLVRHVPYVPRIATLPLELLDRFGAVHLGPGSVGFDGKDIEWDRVVEIRTQHAWASLSADALEANLDQYLTFLPRVPGRGWVFRRVCEVVVSLYLAVLPVDDGEPGAAPTEPDASLTPDTDDAPDHAPPVPDALAAAPAAPTTTAPTAPAPPSPPRGRTVTHIVYRRRIGQGESEASTAAVLLQLAFPEAVEATLREARSREIPVVHTPLAEGEMGRVVARAASWRTTALRLRDAAGRPGEWVEIDDDPPAH